MLQQMLLDADGVFVDLHPELAKVHNFKMEDWKPGCYDIEESFPHISTKELWEHPSIKHPEFWADLPRTPWADELMEFILSKFPKDQICFLTMPVLDPQCAAGKMKWFKRHYPSFKFLIGTSKKFCAGPGKWLLDDSDKNVTEFNKHGGKGILFPRVWNNLHMIKNPMVYIKEQIK